MWYQYRCYRPVILLKIYIIFAAVFLKAQVVAEVHDIHGRLHRIQQLLRPVAQFQATSFTEKTDMETNSMGTFFMVL